MFIMDTILIKPVINGGFEVNVITEIARPSWSGEKLCFFWDQMSSI